jgi:adenine specific DNA methylase Mod
VNILVNLDWEGKSDVSKQQTYNREKYENYFQKVKDFNSYMLPRSKIEGKIWHNKLFWADNLPVLYFLLKQYEGKIDLIYIDPPFFSGSNYRFNIIEKDGKVQEQIAYFDHWDNNLDSYLQMLYERLFLFRPLLSEKGLLFIHLDWHSSHHVRVILDEIFGAGNFVNAVVWHYYNKYSAGKKSLPRAHDDILIYSKTNQYQLNQIRIPRDQPRKQLRREMVNGTLKNAKDEYGHVIYRIVKDKKIDDVWKIPCLQPASKEWTGFPTQKHHELIKRIILLGSNHGDLVADFFCGSGTTLLMAEKLNRKWIGCDISKYAIYLTSQRLSKYLTHLKEEDPKHYNFQMYAHLDDEKKTLLSSDFFEKEIIIKKR